MCRENASVFHNLSISLNQETCRDKFHRVYGSSMLSVYYKRDRDQLAYRLHQWCLLLWNEQSTVQAPAKSYERLGFKYFVSIEFYKQLILAYGLQASDIAFLQDISFDHCRLKITAFIEIYYLKYTISMKY